MSKLTKPSRGLSILKFAKKNKVWEERDSSQSVNDNKETSKLTNRSKVKDNPAKTVEADDNVKTAGMYASSNSKVIEWQK